MQVSNLTGMGGDFTGPNGISGMITVIQLQEVGDELLVTIQLIGICTGGSFQADFQSRMKKGGAQQGADTAGSASSAHDDNTQEDVRRKGEFIADVLYAFLGSALAVNEVSGSLVVPLANGLRVQSQSAGDGFDYPWGLWATYSHTDSEDDFATTAYDSDSDSFMAGMDFQPWDNILTGVAIGYDTTEIQTNFNTGEEDLDSFTVVPYFAIHLTDYVGTGFDLSADGAIGFSFVDIDQFRTAGGARVTSSTDADRYFFSGNVNAGQYFGDFYLSGNTGILVSRENTEGFTESDGTVNADRRSDFGQISIGGRAAYQWGAFEPFASVTYNYEFNRQDVTVATGPQP